jgi:hypothetical protein
MDVSGAESVLLRRLQIMFVRCDQHDLIGFDVEQIGD